MNVVALDNPSGGIGLKCTVGNTIPLALLGHFDIVQETFAAIQHEYLEFVSSAASEMQLVRVRNASPQVSALLRLVAARPIHVHTVVAARVDQFKATPAAIRPFAPAVAIIIRDLVDDHEILIGQGAVIRLGQPDTLAAIGECAGVIAQSVRRVQVRIPGQQVGDILSDYEIAACRNRCADRHTEGDTTPQTPVADVHGRSALIVKLYVFVVVIVGYRVKHDLVDNDIVDQQCSRCVQRTFCGCRHHVEIGRAVRIACRREPVRRRAKPHCINHLSGWTAQPDAVAAHAQRKPEGVLVERDNRTSGECAGGDRVFRDVDIVTERTTVEVSASRAVVEQLYEVLVWQVGMREILVDDDVVVSAGSSRILGARRTAEVVAGRPGFDRSFAVIWSREDERVACAVRSDRPGRVIRIVRIDQHCAESIAQAYGAAATGQIAIIGAEDVGYAVDSLHGGGIARNDQKVRCA